MEYNLQQSVLMSNEGLVNYRYKYRRPLQNLLVIDLLIFDPNNPAIIDLSGSTIEILSAESARKTAAEILPEYERLILEADTIAQTGRQNMNWRFPTRRV